MMKQSNKLTVAVIGGGASGLASAIFAARTARSENISVEINVYDGNSRVGKKILVTGNGRCNFTNENISKSNFHGESDFAYEVYSRFSCEKTEEFFHSLGVFPKSDNAGRVYPMSFQATAILDALRQECQSLGINEICDTKITDIKSRGTGFVLNGSIYADKIILATGGKAAPVQGSDGSGFALLRPFGVECAPLLPALVPLNCENFTKSLKGIRAQGKITLKCEGRVIAEDTGEIQYTDYGLSGIPSMQVSRFASEKLYEKKTVFAHVDSAPYFSADELKRELFMLVKNNLDMPVEMLLSGIMPKKLGTFILSECSLNLNLKIGRLNGSVIEKIVTAVKNKKYKVSSVKGFADAQVTAGGIIAGEINPRTMELKKIKGLHVCGEIINVDGDCGGYNLQWAWSSAYVAGTSIIREN